VFSITVFTVTMAFVICSNKKSSYYFNAMTSETANRRSAEARRQPIDRCEVGLYWTGWANFSQYFR